MMKKVIIIFLVVILFGFSQNVEIEKESQQNKKEETQKTQLDVELVIEKIDEIERRVDEIEKKMKKIEENFNEIRKVIRNFQISTQLQATIKPTEEEWKSIKTGMKKEDVMKILGSPEEIKKLKDQSEIWYYFGVGRIFFNPNGEVVKTEKDIYIPRGVIGPFIPTNKTGKNISPQK
jgi:chaperonin cofactor prefoldin